MQETIQIIPLTSLALTFIPVILVLGILYRWSLAPLNSVYALSRMLIQLLVIGYILSYIFEAKNFWIVLGILAMMSCTASWIALRTQKHSSRVFYFKALLSIGICGSAVLALISQVVIDLDPWYAPRYLIPLAGMVYAHAMNGVSLAVERLEAELERDASYEKARSIALNAALIPITNSLFAVGLVSLPGMMTGQILSGVSPLIAVRYQIMVMCMMFGATGLSTASFLVLVKSHYSS